MNNNLKNEITLFTNMQIWYHKHIIHFMMIFIITGTPFVSSSLSWVAYLFGVPVAVFSGVTSSQEILATGMQVCRILHRASAVFWLLISIPFIFSMLPKISKWGITPHRTEEQSWGEYIKEGLIDTKRVYIDWQYPKYAGKYNLAQILAAWAVIFICLVMVLSGTVLWFRGSFSAELASFMRVIHLAGYIAMILFLIFHIYFAVHPINKAGYKAMFRDGKDNIENAKKKRPGLFKAIK